MLKRRGRNLFIIALALVVLAALALPFTGCNPGGSDAGGGSGTRGPSQRAVGGGTSVSDVAGSGTTGTGTASDAKSTNR